MKSNKVLILQAVLIFVFLFSSESFAAQTSSKKGVATLQSGREADSLGVSNFYRYSPYSTDHQTTPMIKRCSINVLRNNQNPDVCNYSGTDSCTADGQCSGKWACCPAWAIRETVRSRETGGYWLIFNEPDIQEDYPNAVTAANDADFAINFIKDYDPQAKFILGWYPGIQNYHNLPNRIAGWHIHTYHWNYTLGGTGGINDYKDLFINEIVNHTTNLLWSEKELWLTEFGTLMGQYPPGTWNPKYCDNLSRTTDCQCRFDRIDSDSNQLCVYFMESLLNWLESPASPVDKYFWWNKGPCRAEYRSGGYIVGQEWVRDICYGPLINENGGLNKLGEAFANIGSQSTVTSTPTVRPTATVTPSPIATSTPTATPSPIVTPNPTITPTPTPATIDKSLSRGLNKIDLSSVYVEESDDYPANQCRISFFNQGWWFSRPYNIQPSVTVSFYFTCRNDLDWSF